MQFGPEITLKNNDIKDTLKVIRSSENREILWNGTTSSSNKVKEQKGGFLGTLAATLHASFLRNMLEGRGMISAVPKRKTTISGLWGIWVSDGTIRAGEGTTRAGQDF